MANRVTVYTDGACSGNPGPGGWGAILVSGALRKEISGSEPATTNNRMELTAAIEALRALKGSSEADLSVDLYTDSTYVKKGITEWIESWKRNGWRRRSGKRWLPVKNEDLWRALDELVVGHRVTFHWVEGHSGHEENERADQLAREAIAGPTPAGAGPTPAGAATHRPVEAKTRPRPARSRMSKVVCTSFLFPELVDRMEGAGYTVWTPPENGPLPRDRLVAELTGAEALICLLTDRIDRELLLGAPNLRVVANVAVGYENVDVAAASERGIIVTNTPDVLTEATADLTFALLLAAARRVAEADAAVRRGEFPAWGLDQALTGSDAHGKTLGIVGMGRIGTAVARRGRLGFGMQILYYSRTRNDAAERELDARYVAVDALLEESDFVCVHVPLTDETHHLFDAAAFERMKPTAILINVSRGAVVDEEALVSALESGAIAGAGLDVYENEPAIHPGLLALRERVVLTPHIGSATWETRHAMARLAVDNVLSVLAGHDPITPVLAE